MTPESPGSPGRPGSFAGERHAPMRSPLARLERRFIDANVGRFPAWIQGYHLTLMTIGWSAGVLAFGWLSQHGVHWLWGSSAMLVGQWFTDSFDGSLGKLRDTGIPRWGFYMDHLLDFLFMWCVPVSYVWLVDGVTDRALVVAFAFIFSAMMANSFLALTATSRFKITYLGLGPTEIRLGYVALNVAIVVAGPEFLPPALPWAVGVAGVALLVIVYRTQRVIWTVERPTAGRRPPSPPAP